MRRLRIPANLLHQYSREALRAARMYGEEICGLLVNDGNGVILVPVHNAAFGGFNFDMKAHDWLIALRARGLAVRHVVGTYHSHPISAPIPSPGDISGARGRIYMLILTRRPGERRTWYIARGRSFPVATLVRRP